MVTLKILSADSTYRSKMLHFYQFVADHEIS